MSTSIDLTDEQWGEIYYALDTKLRMVKEGYYGPEEHAGDDERWAEDLEEIMAVISNKVSV